MPAKKAGIFLADQADSGRVLRTARFFELVSHFQGFES